MKKSPDKLPAESTKACPDCDGVSRRRFLQGAGVVAASAALPALPLVTPTLRAATSKPRPEQSAENYVKLFHETLSTAQRQVMHFPFDHEKRSMISNNWDIVDPDVASIGRFYTPNQQEILQHILRSATSEDGYERYQKQMKDDAGGFDKYTCALFGNPGEEKFEWVLTGRHCTLRVDGNSVENVAFGGPIFYGHAVTFDEEPHHPGNVWWHQGKRANEVFQALDGKQRAKALLSGDAPPDDASTIRLRGYEEQIPGLPGAEMSADQKKLLEETMKSLLSMFRPSDVEEAVECIKKNGGFDQLHLSFYKEDNLGNDEVWDLWRVEGPTFVWYFRGAPHVHVWVNLAHRAGKGRVRRV